MEMGMTGESTSTAAIAIVCPTCGDVYDTADQVREVLLNSGHCVNLTCLEDLSSEPVHEYFTRSGEGRRTSDWR